MFYMSPELPEITESNFSVKGFDPSFPDGSPPADKVIVGGVRNPTDYVKNTMKEWQAVSKNKLSMPALKAPNIQELPSREDILNSAPKYEKPEIFLPPVIELPKFPTKASIQVSSI